MESKDMQYSRILSLESSIGYKFKKINLLKEALCHSSFVNEYSGRLKDNEQLEFLGDSVLNFIISDLLMQYYPEVHEGDLSRMRASLVNESQLSIIAKSIKLGSYIYLGKGELQTNGRDKKSILADTLEAIIAAVYLDGGINSTFMLVRNLFDGIIELAISMSIDIDYKSQLQEKAQVLYRKTPIYSVVGEYGPDHNKIFRVCMNLGDLVSYGEGGSKKEAEQLAPNP